MYDWKVVPLCKEQLLDIDPKDVLPGGHFRLCDTYKSGGGYDKFAAIFEKRTGRKIDPRQFVVQLYGCRLKCPYCYVTPNGIWGEPVLYNTDDLARSFFDVQKIYKHLDTFHLMGGSPALYIDHWPELIERLGPDVVFHSDLCLTERAYHPKYLTKIAKPNCLYAVNIKGVTLDDYARNTGSEFPSADWELLWHNLNMLFISRVPFYMTFTNPDTTYLDAFCRDVVEDFGQRVLDDMIVIDLIDYDAVKAYNCSKGVQKHGNYLQI